MENSRIINKVYPKIIAISLAPVGIAVAVYLYIFKDIPFKYYSDGSY